MNKKCTRLNLNWTLDFKDERSEWISDYLKTLNFIPDEDELDMMAKYILWGKSRENGLNGRQEGLQLETSHGTWDTNEVESLDALTESPTFNETFIRPPNAPAYKTPKETFSREDARSRASHLLPYLEPLWRDIDKLELELQFYDLAHSKRSLPIRSSLLSSFSESELNSIRTKASKLSLYKYLSKKHELVELRRQQFAYKDFYAPQIELSTTFNFVEDEPIVFGTDVSILPLSPLTPLKSKLWRQDRFPEPSDFSEDELSLLTKILWSPAQSKYIFDFTNPSNLSTLNSIYLEARQDYTPSLYNSNLNILLNLFDVYVALTPLKPIQLEVLNLKRSGAQNEKIREILRQKFNQSYTLNYISTLYHKSILSSIADTARLHYEVCANLMFPENFKTCIDCGKTLLRDTNNFMHKSKVKDGFDCRCKACAKIKRNGGK